MTQDVAAFVIHDPRDDVYLEQLQRRLRSLRRTAKLNFEPLRSQNDLPAGAPPDTLEAWLRQADVIILLLSEDFNVSLFAECMEPDYIQIVKERYEQGVLLIPLMVRPVDATWIFDGVPDPPGVMPGNSISVSQMEEDNAWATITQNIRELTGALLRRRDQERSIQADLKRLERRINNLEQAFHLLSPVPGE